MSKSVHGIDKLQEEYLNLMMDVDDTMDDDIANDGLERMDEIEEIVGKNVVKKWIKIKANIDRDVEMAMEREDDNF